MGAADLVIEWNPEMVCFTPDAFGVLRSRPLLPSELIRVVLMAEYQKLTEAKRLETEN